MESITANEVAGLGVGALLLAAALAAPRVDAFIARGQRRDLKLCMECGGVTKIPCVKCKARGTLIQSLFSLQESNNTKPVACPACRGKGNFPCPSCQGNKSASSSSLDCLGESGKEGRLIVTVGAADGAVPVASVWARAPARPLHPHDGADHDALLPEAPARHGASQPGGAALQARQRNRVCPFPPVPLPRPLRVRHHDGVVPDGPSPAVNPEGIAYYNKLIDSLLKKGDSGLDGARFLMDTDII